MNNHDQIAFDTLSCRQVIKTAKQLLANNPKNPILWCDRSRSHLILGQDNQAASTITIALNLAPENRFILRSAARLFIHLGDVEQAYRLMLKSPITKTDPWLYATFINCCLLNNKSPNKVPRKLHKKISPDLIFPQSELLESVALIETYNGRHKDARQIVETTLRNPSSNAVAHAEWLLRMYYPHSLHHLEKFTGRSSEAATHYHFSQASFDEALDSAHQWQSAEPFSSRPGIEGTYIASIAGLHERGIAFAEECLHIHPNNFTIRNNMILSLIAKNRLEEAHEHLTHNRPEKSTSDEVCHIATKGRYLFAKSRIDEGRIAYREAAALIDSLKLPNLHTSLDVNLLFSEARYTKQPHTPNLADKIEKYTTHKSLAVSTIAVRGIKWLRTLEKKKSIAYTLFCEQKGRAEK